MSALKEFYSVPKRQRHQCSHSRLWHLDAVLKVAWEDSLKRHGHAAMNLYPVQKMLKVLAVFCQGRSAKMSQWDWSARVRSRVRMIDPSRFLLSAPVGELGLTLPAQLKTSIQRIHHSIIPSSFFFLVRARYQILGISTSIKLYIHFALYFRKCIF